MKKISALSLGLFLATSSSAFANYISMNCEVVGQNLVIESHFIYDEGDSREESDYPRSDAKRPFYNHLANDVTFRSGTQERGTVAQKGNYGYFRFETYDGTFLPPTLKVDFKNDEGTTIVIRATGQSAKPGNPTGNAFQTVRGSATAILRGADKKIGLQDLRDVQVECNADTD